MTYAGFWKRAVAFLIDYVAVFIANTLFGFVIGFILGFAMALSGATPDGEMDSNAFLTVGMIIGIILTWLYFALLESSSKQATLGKMAVGVKVVDLAGNRISFWRATGRHFAKILSALTFLIGYIIAAFTEKKQALHDMIAGTLVING